MSGNFQSHSFVQHAMGPNCTQCNRALVDHQQYAPVQENGGKKFDTGKPPLSLIPRRAQEEEARVLAFGLGKYGRDNWRKGLAMSRIVDAILRHAVAYAGGETLDPETGLSHLAHIRCEAGFGLEFEVTHPELDDRYKPTLPKSYIYNHDCSVCKAGAEGLIAGRFITFECTQHGKLTEI